MHNRQSAPLIGFLHTPISHFRYVLLEGDDHYITEAHSSYIHDQNADAAVKISCLFNGIFTCEAIKYSPREEGETNPKDKPISRP